MAVNGIAIASNRVNALNAGNPVFASGNQLANGTNIKLTTGGLITSTDITDPSYDISSIYDNKLSVGARPSLSTFTTFYVSGTLPTDTTVDCCFVHLSNLVGQVSVRLDISGVDDFSSLDSAGPEITSASTYSSSNPGSERFVWWGLEASGNAGWTWVASGSDNIRFRVRIFSSSAISPPLVNEVFLGQFRVFSRPYASVNDLDDRPAAAEWREHVSANRDSTRYITAAGFADHVGVQDYSGTANGDIGGLDDLATLRLLQQDNLYGAQPTWYRQQGQGPTYLGTFESPIHGTVQRGQPFRRQTVFDFRESPPFAEPEFTGTGVSSGVVVGARSSPTSYMTTSPGNYVSVPEGTIDGFFDGASEMVIAFWMRRSAVTSTQTIMSRGSTQILFRTHTDRWTFNWYSIGRGTTFDYADNFTPDDSVWHFYAARFRNNQVADLWIDGDQATGTGTGANPLTLLADTGAMQIGDGNMDIGELAIYSGQGFTSSGVANLYFNKGSPDYENALTSSTGLTVTGSPTFT